MNQTSSPDALTARHVRAARALLAWSQQDLAKRAGVATSTVADFERGHRKPVANNAQAIRDALEGAGVRFLPTGAVIGPTLPEMPGVAGRTGAPVRWVSAEDLAEWADRMDGAVSLPTLVSRLIFATHGPAARLRFPSDESVRHPGWDGRTLLETGGVWVPGGETGWEIGAQRSAIARKAEDDFRKRTAMPAPLVPAESAYIFVTPRRWPDKDAWARACQAEGVWREVRVYDADDLVHWIEQTPAVGLWLAARLGKRPPGIRELEDIWNEWSLATQWPLTADLVLADRDEDAAEVLRWLRAEPSVLALQGSTPEEVVAFFHAALAELPGDLAEAYRNRCLVATTPDAARALADAPAPLILILTDPDPGLAQSLTLRGHYVLLAYDDRPVTHGEVRPLARPSREGLAEALLASGIAEPRARALARDSGRNLAVLRRLIPSAPDRVPSWAENPHPALKAAMLIGGWNETVEGDRERLAAMADQPYDDVIAALAPYVGAFDSPLRKIGPSWRIASPPDAWLLLAHALASIHLDRFEAAARAVLGAADPRFDLEPDERWLAGLRGVQPRYSGLLRHGIGQVLILLALWGDRVRTVPDAGRRAELIVAGVLREADARRWWSLSDDFRLLAEASPKAFLDAVDDSLDADEPPIIALFGHDEGGLFGAEHLSDLMWALESLAWSPDLLPRVTHLLARLDAIDVRPRRFTNGPANSLREIYLLWNPQTHAPLADRLRALDLIRKREPAAAWKVMLSVLPKGHDFASPTAQPQWRDFTTDKVETVTWAVVGRGAAEISRRLVEDVGIDPERWAALLDRLGDLTPDAGPALSALDGAEAGMDDLAARDAMWDKLRRVLHHHRQFEDADWALPAEVLERLAEVYDRFAPVDRLARTAWLFEPSAPLPDPPTAGWEAQERDVDEARKVAAREVLAEGGLAAVLALARLTETAGYLGKALYDGGLPETDLDALIESAARSDDTRVHNLAHGLVAAASRDRDPAWGTTLIGRAESQAWGETALIVLLRALPVGRATWDEAARLGEAIDAVYWRRMPVFWMSEDEADIAFAVRKLIAVGRARHALPLACRPGKAQLPSALLVEALEAAAAQPSDEGGDSNSAVMFQHYVAEILKILDDRTDLEDATLARLEWNYLRVLEHSRRPAKVILRAMSEQPSLFVEMLSFAFKAAEGTEGGDATDESEPEPKDPEQLRVIALQAYRLLDLWDHIPGAGPDGVIDAARLEAWIKEARALAKAAQRADIADSKIGNMLSASPPGADGVWPAEAVRDALDLFRSKPMLNGFQVGKRNRRGVTTRLPGDGGELERNEEARFRDWAKAIAYDHPHTAKALNAIADSYAWDARRHDEDAERLDWI